MSVTTEAAPKKRLTKKEWGKLSSTEKAELRKQKVKEGEDAFNEAMAVLVDDESFREALRAASMCHKYSTRNRLWVAVQRGGNIIGPVASYSDWKNKLGYQVRKGEVGAMIWVPVPVKIKAKVHDDPDEDAAEITKTRFKIGKVFTRDQVDPIEGKALNLDGPAPAPIEGDSHGHLVPLLKTYLADKIGWSFKELDKDSANQCYGWCDRTNKEIAVRTDMPANGQVRTFVHELIHALGVSYDEYGRSLAETITESACYLVCRAIGLDVLDTSVPYVANWSKNDLDAAKREIHLIGTLADKLLADSGLDNHLALSEGEAVLLGK